MDEADPLAPVFHDPPTAQVRVFGERIAWRSAAVVIDRIDAVHGICRTAAGAVGIMNESGVRIPDGTPAKSLGVFSTGCRGVVVVPNVQGARVLRPLVLLVLLDRHPHVIVLVDQFVDNVAAADRGIVVAADLLP